MLKHLPPPNPGLRPGAGRSSGRPQQPLNVSALSTATSLGSVVGSTPASAVPPPPSLSISNNNPPKKQQLANGRPRSSAVLNTTPLTSISSSTNLLQKPEKNRTGAREALTSLGLLCLVSLLLALLSLIFLLKISPSSRDLPPGPTFGDDYTIVYDVTLALCALSLSLNLCCLLVCAIQFLFAVKLVKTVAGNVRTNKYLEKSSASRICAVAGFFISIPIFLTGIILYTFTHFQSTPAIITSILIGLGIVFCGAAIVHNVFVWQKEKTICVRHNAVAAAMLATSPSMGGGGGMGNQSLLTPITPPSQFLNQNSMGNHNMSNHNLTGGTYIPSLSAARTASPTTNLLNLNLGQLNHSHMNGPIGNANHTPLTHTTSQLSHTPITPVTPLSGNHSHMSFHNNHSALFANYGLRPAAATPPPMKQTNRDATGSISPGLPCNLDVSNATTSNSQHELSTLV